MRVAVYGNLIYDQLLTIEDPLVPGDSHDCKVSTAIGGIGNFCRAAKGKFDVEVHSFVGNDEHGRSIRKELENYATLKIKESPLPTSFASVICDKKNCSRTGFVQWGACRHEKGLEPADVDWTHIMYLDRIRITPEELMRLTRPISIDMCNVDDLYSYWKLLPLVDYIIVSESKNYGMLDDVSGNKGIIIHSPTTNRFRFPHAVGCVKNSIVEGLNVVGAGDYFAAFTIANLLIDQTLIAGGSPVPDMLRIHEQTLNMLKRQSQ